MIVLDFQFDMKMMKCLSVNLTEFWDMYTNVKKDNN